MLHWRPLASPFPLHLLITLLFCVSCAGPGAFAPRISDAERAAYAEATALEASDPSASAKALEDFMQAWPDSALADDASESLARIALGQGRGDDAFRWLYHILEAYPDGDKVDAARVRLARWEFKRGEVGKARSLAAAANAKKLSDADRRSYYLLQAELAVDPVERLGHLARLRRLAQDAYDDVSDEPESPVAERLRATLASSDAEIDSVLERMSDDMLMRASSSLSGSIPAARTRLILARRLLDAGDFERASKLLGDGKRHALSAGDEERVASLELRLGLGADYAAGAAHLPTFREAAKLEQPDLALAQGAIGVVLPLSGQFAEFGAASLRGVLLAAQIFDAQGTAEDAGTVDVTGGQYRDDNAGSSEPEAGDFEHPALRIVVRDSEGSPERAAAAVRELAEDPSIVAIIGPLTSKASESAASAAEQSDVPLVALTSRQSVPSERDYVFRIGTTPDDEVGFLVEYAFETLGARTFAVLYPRSRYGRGMRTRYWDAVLEHGGTMVGAASYDPEANDFSGPIRSMIGYSLLTRDEKTALQERSQAIRRGRRLEPEDMALLREVVYSMMGPEAEPLPPIVDFDALFIPDSHQKITLIAPQLAYHEITGVQLLGSSDWNDPRLVEIGRDHVRGAVISTPFNAQSKFEIVQAFVADYRARFGEDPNSFSSHGFDAATLIMRELAMGHDSRPQVRDGILRVHGYPGTSGVISMQSDGNARKRPFLLEVQRSRIVGLD
jgi:ABC-type branched-subunit amino acid transport system substrate-binding protein